jgi:ABC-type transport system substrate-binding protein
MMNLLLRITRALRLLSRTERIVLCVLIASAVVSFAGLLRVFYLQSTTVSPAKGGTYIEGSVGDLQPLMPWFTIENDVSRDIVSLVFSGLVRYNPLTKKIEDNIAAVTVSPDGLLYTARLKKDLPWHDSTQSNPHYVTADDVVFTYKTIQDATFPNVILAQNFRGVTVEKVDDRTVRFKLAEPYAFFASNLTLGIMPRRNFEGIPPSRVAQATEFGFSPVGSGPYKLRSIVETELSTEVTLERFEASTSSEYNLDRMVFRIFPDYQSLLSDLKNIDGVRVVPKSAQGQAVIPRSFVTETYTLPQYVGLFFNMQRKALQDATLRLALQLGTNKQGISDKAFEPSIVDTPLLEIDTADWRYHFDAAAAQGALFHSNWNLPEKVRLQRLLEQREANDLGMLKIDPVVLLDTGALLTVTGSFKEISLLGKLNGISLRKGSGAGIWSIKLPTAGTGSLRLGQNLIRLTDQDSRGRERIVDSFYLWRTTDGQEYRKRQEEQRLVELFIQTRDGKPPVGQAVTIAELFVEGGVLRRRHPTDPVSVRVNDAGVELSIRLLTSPSPPVYPTIAEEIQQQWTALGARVTVDVPKSRDEFQRKLLSREYDVLLFGQSLLDNLDSYPYWHSTGVQRLTGLAKDLRLDAYNLSQYSSFQADALLETIRRVRSEKERQNALKQLRDVLKKDVPAIFLYTPTYTFAHRPAILGVTLGRLSMHSDRLFTAASWYRHERRAFKEGVSWFSFFGWLPKFVMGG